MYRILYETLTHQFFCHKAHTDNVNENTSCKVLADT